MYYVDTTMLDEDDRYVVEGKSRIGSVVMQIIVFEAIVLGIIAEIASRELYADMTFRGGIEMAMLISIIITPMAIFVNNYAQKNCFIELKEFYEKALDEENGIVVSIY